MVTHVTVTQHGLRAKLYHEMEPKARDHPGVSPINAFIVGLVLLSLVALAIETEPSISDTWRRGLFLFNIVIIAIFAFEYLVRLWIAGEDPRYRGVTGRIRYVFTPYAIADLIAFLPEMLFLIHAQGNSEQTLMMLRVLRLFRLVKIARCVPAFDILGAAMRRAGSQLLTTLAVALALVYISAVALYFIEGIGQGREEFGSIPRAVWWAIATLTTVGYGDVYPVTTLGRVAASVIALAGIGVVALPAGVFASAFSDELREREQEKAARKAAAGLGHAPGDERATAKD